MRKFKIKNRQKRKYVKKQDLSASFAHVHELTLGVIPMLLMGIAFFATFLMGNPQVIAHAIPAGHISIPEISLPNIPELPEFTFPALSFPELTLPHISFPQVTLPQLTMPEIKLSFDLPQVSFPQMPEFSLPVITLPNIMPFFVNAFNVASAGVDTFVQSITSFIINFGVWLVVSLGQMKVILTDLAVQTGTVTFTALQIAGHNIALAAIVTWNALSITVSAVSTVLVNGYYRIGLTLVMGGQFLITITIQAVILAVTWIQILMTAIINGLNAFVWFLGTPFRALGNYSEQVSIAMAPLFNYLGDTFNRSINDLNAGVYSLEQSTEYVSNSVASQ